MKEKFNLKIYPRQDTTHEWSERREEMTEHLQVAFNMENGKSGNAHSLQNTFRCCPWRYTSKTVSTAAINMIMMDYLKKFALVLSWIGYNAPTMHAQVSGKKKTPHSLSGPPSWLIAFSKRLWSSCVHFNRSFEEPLERLDPMLLVVDLSILPGIKMSSNLVFGSWGCYRDEKKHKKNSCQWRRCYVGDES